MSYISSFLHPRAITSLFIHTELLVLLHCVIYLEQTHQGIKKLTKAPGVTIYLEILTIAWFNIRNILIALWVQHQCQRIWRIEKINRHGAYQFNRSGWVRSWGKVVMRVLL